MFRRALLQQSRLSLRSSVPRVTSTAPRFAATSARPAIPQLQSAAGRIRCYSTEKKADIKEEDVATEGKPATEPLKKEEEELKKITQELDALQKEVDTKDKEIKEYKDKFQRAVAEYHNLQSRAEREQKKAREYAIQKFAKDLVDSVDNLDRALQAVPEESRSNAERNKELVDLYNGLKMTEDILLNTMKKHGLEKINPLGEPFDPNVHEATFQVHMPDKEPNTVFHVQQTGFTLNGRTIRAAKVGVVSQPPK
ncbi:GrpE protein [Ascodesmis nigricans]|uniref:GrpE protein homolog n=1 Tax=Ascodesmis nigricans TaxID=341454 RepID=A0A4S2MTH2_9PEZI|nr:GrpE protein [Ascodesmis nigricans]